MVFGMSRGQYQPLNAPSAQEAAHANTWQAARYREHMKYGRNPDQFYVDIYEYHQSGGFWSVFLSEILWTVKFIFVVFVGIELTVCTRWNVLTNHTAPVTQWSDVFTPPGQCWASLPLLPSLLVAGAFLALLFQLGHAINRLKRFWETRRFCTYTLDMPTSSTGLGDMTWSEVQKRLIASQPQTGLDELAVCHRVTRHVNYLIAMVDQDVLPVRFNLSTQEPPMTYVYLPESYLFNIKLILFGTPWSPFAEPWLLKAEYKDIGRRHDLSLHLAKLSRILGVLNLLFSPIILLSQFLVFICSNAERIRYHPASIMGRRWSNYASFYLRHYNELKHQFLVRIGLAYEPACRYLECFVSRNLISVAETVAFVLGSASVAFFLLGLVHDHVLHLSGYWAILVVGGLLARACLSYIPDESSVRSPRALLVNILGKIHHFRDYWIEQAETSRVCVEFSQLFQYRLCAAAEDLASSVVTPFLLMFVLPNHTDKIVDFLRNYTVELKDIGDVCSFAQLDIRRHGDPNWRFFPGADDEQPDVPGSTNLPTSDLAQPLVSTGGKTELSLMHFHLNNPDCELPPASRAYLESIRMQLLREMSNPTVQTPLSPIEQREGGPLPAANLFSSLYGIQNTTEANLQPNPTTISPFTSNEFTPGPLKNASQLPGPGHVDGKSLGFVGAMVESMRVSMHRSDPGMIRSTTSESTIPKTRPEKEPFAGDGKSAHPTEPCPSPEHTSVPPPAFSHFVQARGADLVNNSLMATSANPSCYPAYRPYVSQIENGSSQMWGLGTSYALGHSANRHGLAELLTADTSASILYMHELAQRRRLQQSMEQSSLGPHVMGRSSLTGISGSLHSSAVPPPYQPSQTASPVIRVVGRSFTNRSAGIDRGFPVYGSTSTIEAVGVVRSGSDRGVLMRQAVDRVNEEDELSTTPRPFTDSHVHTVSGEGRHGVNVAAQTSGSATHHAANLVDQPPGLNDGTDTEHLWPDLPPTNC